MDHSGHDMHNHMAHMNHGAMGGTKMDMGNDTDMPMDMSNCTMVMNMAMSFHAGYDETVLFDFWVIDNVWKLVVSMIGLFLIAFLYEGLKYAREHLFRKSISKSQYTSSEKSNVTIADGSQPVSLSMTSGAHFAQTLLHMLQFFVSYCLMLVFMTYNVWLCLACLLGSGAGYFFFGWRKSVVVDITEHCH